MLKRTYTLKDSNGFTDNEVITRNDSAEIKDATGATIILDSTEIKQLLKILTNMIERK
jgi:hypothetical protein